MFNWRNVIHIRVVQIQSSQIIELANWLEIEVNCVLISLKAQLDHVDEILVSNQIANPLGTRNFR